MRYINRKSDNDFLGRSGLGLRSGLRLGFQSGFSLIELMIAIVIGLIVLAALIALYLNVSRSNNELAKTNFQIESGRFAIQILQNDIVHGGFWGSYVPQFNDLTATGAPADVPTAVPDVCLAYNATNWNAGYKTNLIGIPVQSYSTMPSSCSSVVVGSQKANTDVLVVRHAETCVAGSGGNCGAYVANGLYFQSSLCQPPLPTSMTPDASAYILGTTGFDTTLHKKNCTALVTDKYKFVSSIYYVDTIGGIPTLMRSSFDLSAGTLAQQTAVPLIEGVEGFIVELGIDNLSDNGTDVINDADATNRYTAAIKWASATSLTSPTNRGDGIADSFVRCTTASPCTVQQLSNVVAVKLYVLVRAPGITAGHTDGKTYTLGSTTLGPFNDQYKRHVFSTTVRLHNVSGRRETP